MGILIAYFLWVASVLAVIVTAWIGIADSGVANVHLRRATAMHRSYDAYIMAEDKAAAAKQTAKAETAKTAMPPTVASARRAEARPPRRRQAKARAHTPTQAWQTARSGARSGWRSGQPLATDPRFALGGAAPFGDY